MGPGLSCRLSTSMVQPNFASMFSSSKWFHATPSRQDEFGIATGVEREELEQKQEEAPMIVESHYDVRIIGCSGGVGEDEHDISWFHLEKDKTIECSICTQVFKLKVIGIDGQPGHDEHH